MAHPPARHMSYTKGIRRDRTPGGGFWSSLIWVNQLFESKSGKAKPFFTSPDLNFIITNNGLRGNSDVMLLKDQS